jgi:uncharacterized membrane protein
MTPHPEGDHHRVVPDRSSKSPPPPLLLLLSLATAAALLWGFFLLGGIEYAYQRIGIPEGAMFGLIFAELAGSAINIPIKVGIIGGPLGMLIRGTTGSFAGSIVDTEDEESTPTALTAISSSARPGRTALLAVVKEQSWQVVDAAMSGLGGTVLRRSVYEVEAEIAAAEQAERTAKREARKELLRGRREHDKEAAHAKVENLKARRASRA